MPTYQTRREVVQAERVAIHTLVGTDFTADPGDWVVTFAKGEVVVFSDEVFREQFEPAPGDDAAVQMWSYHGQGD